MLPGPEDHKQWSHPLHCPNPVFFLLKLAPGWDHSHLEWFQSRNGQCAFWYSSFLWAGETQGCFLVFCWRTKSFAVQNKGGGTSAVRMCLGIQSPSTRKMCENNPGSLNSLRIKLWSAPFCVKSEAEPTADLLRKPIVSQQHPANVRQLSHWKGVTQLLAFDQCCLFLWIYLNLIFTCWPQSRSGFKFNAVPCFQVALGLGQILKPVESSSTDISNGTRKVEARVQGTVGHLLSTAALVCAALKWLWNYGRTSRVSSAE